MFEDFINAIHNFRTNKMRTVLSLLGIVIGVTSVVIITSLASSLSNSIAKQFESFSMDILKIGISGGNFEFSEKESIKFDDKFREMMMKKIPKIKNIFYSTVLESSVIRDNLRIEYCVINGIEPNRLESHRTEIDYGSFFDSSDYTNGEAKAIIGDRVAFRLFPEGRAVGKFINLQIYPINENDSPYTVRLQVAGVLKPKESWLINTSDIIFVPRKFALNNFPKTGDIDKVWSAEVCTFTPEDAYIVETKIRDISAELTGGDKFAIWIFSPRQQFEQMNKMTSLVGFVLSCIAGISLLVGGIGIMNIMLVTVTERRKEIGIRKALGATGRAIKIQFLVESAALTLTGGIVGIFAGLLISKLIVNVFFPSEIIFLPNFLGSVIAFAVSMFTGIFFGLHPAIKASKLDPVQALAE